MIDDREIWAAALAMVKRYGADVMASAHKGAAEGMAAALPPAPRCPL